MYLLLNAIGYYAYVTFEKFERINNLFYRYKSGEAIRIDEIFSAYGKWTPKMAEKFIRGQFFR
jgi:hypothetical protein